MDGLHRHWRPLLLSMLLVSAVSESALAYHGGHHPYARGYAHGYAYGHGHGYGHRYYGHGYHANYYRNNNYVGYYGNGYNGYNNAWAWGIPASVVGATYYTAAPRYHCYWSNHHKVCRYY